MDESFKQLIGEVREPLPPSPGRVERYDSIYVRNGMASLFLAFEPLAGWREVKVTDTRNRTDWAHFIRELVEGKECHTAGRMERVLILFRPRQRRLVQDLLEAVGRDDASRFESLMEAMRVRIIVAR